MNLRLLGPEKSFCDTAVAMYYSVGTFPEWTPLPRFHYTGGYVLATEWHTKLAGLVVMRAGFPI